MSIMSLIYAYFCISFVVAGIRLSSSWRSRINERQRNVLLYLRDARWC